METDVKDRKIILNGTPAWLHLYKRTVVVVSFSIYDYFMEILSSLLY